MERAYEDPFLDSLLESIRTGKVISDLAGPISPHLDQGSCDGRNTVPVMTVNSAIVVRASSKAESNVEIISSPDP